MKKVLSKKFKQHEITWDTWDSWQLCIHVCHFTICYMFSGIDVQALVMFLSIISYSNMMLTFFPLSVKEAAPCENLW